MSQALHRTRVKICGLTRREDALLAADLGADALGFVFAPRSRRRASPESVARIAEELPPFVTLVGVFLDQPEAEVRETVSTCRLSVAQLHGSKDPDYVRRLGLRVLKAVSLVHREDLDQLARYPGLSAFLLDSVANGERGGTGKAFDWGWAADARRFGRIVLAGGLHPGNVADAMRTARPWAVDVCSGTESSPGIKDPGKLRDFICRVRETDAQG